jgi:hypothetical protein
MDSSNCLKHETSIFGIRNLNYIQSNFLFLTFIWGHIVLEAVHVQSGDVNNAHRNMGSVKQSLKLPDLKQNWTALQIFILTLQHKVSCREKILSYYMLTHSTSIKSLGEDANVPKTIHNSILHIVHYKTSLHHQFPLSNLNHIFMSFDDT